MTLPANQAPGATFAPAARFAFEGVGYVRRDVGYYTGVKPAHDGAAKAHAMRATLANERAKASPLGAVLIAGAGLAIGVCVFAAGVYFGLW